MANYLFQDYPGTLAVGEVVYAVLYNPSTLEIYNPGTTNWVAANTVANVATVAINATALQNTGVYYITLNNNIEDDPVLAKWWVGQSASKNVGTDIAIGNSGYTPATAGTTVTQDDIDAIAAKVISMAVTGAGTLQKHSLGSLVLICSNADTTTTPGKLVTRDPNSNTILQQYDITTGHGQPVRSIT